MDLTLIPQLNGENYLVWRRLIEGLLWEQDLFLEVMKPDDAAVEAMPADVILKKHIKAQSIVLRHIRGDIASTIPDGLIVPDMLKHLEGVHERNSFFAQQRLLAQISRIRYTTGSFKEHADLMTGLFNQLAATGWQDTEAAKVAQFINTFPAKFEPIVTWFQLYSIASGRPVQLSTAVRYFVEHEERCRLREAEAAAELARHGEQIQRGTFQRGWKRTEWWRTHKLCHFCKKPGHLQRFCYARKNKMRMMAMGKDPNFQVCKLTLLQIIIQFFQNLLNGCPAGNPWLINNLVCYNQ